MVLWGSNYLIQFYQVVVFYSTKEAYSALKEQIIEIQNSVKRWTWLVRWNWSNLFNGLSSRIIGVLYLVKLFFLKETCKIIPLVFLLEIPNSFVSGVATKSINLLSFIVLVLIMLRAAYLLQKCFFFLHFSLFFFLMKDFRVNVIEYFE